MDEFVEDWRDVVAGRNGRPMLLLKLRPIFLQMLAQGILGSAIPSPAAKVGGHGLNDAEADRGIGKDFFHLLGEFTEIVLPLHPA